MSTENGIPDSNTIENPDKKYKNLRSRIGYRVRVQGKVSLQWYEFWNDNPTPVLEEDVPELLSQIRTTKSCCGTAGTYIIRKFELVEDSSL